MSRLHDMGGRFGDGPIPIPRKKIMKLIITNLRLNTIGMQKHGQLL